MILVELDGADCISSWFSSDYGCWRVYIIHVDIVVNCLPDAMKMHVCARRSCRMLNHTPTPDITK